MIQFCAYLMDLQLNHILFRVKWFFVNNFGQHLGVYQYLKKIYHLIGLRDLLKWKYPHRIYGVFLNNLEPGI